MHIGFLGFGLISGSVARAVRAGAESGTWTMAAWSPSNDGPRAARADGIVDTVAERPEGAIAEADLVVLGGPATACLAMLDDLAGAWASALLPAAVITDVASTKGALVARADAQRLRYVGGHPMAGRETSGYEAGTADLFVDRPWVVVPGVGATRADIDLVGDLARICGARVVEMDAVGHDQAVAAVSHLPLIVAAALVEAVAGPPGASRADWPAAHRLVAGGWRDMTRLARGDSAMGAAIAATNGPALVARLRDLRAVIDDWLELLEGTAGADEAAIEARLRAARDRLEAEL